jgi:hypothetical protein
MTLTDGKNPSGDQASTTTFPGAYKDTGPWKALFLLQIQLPLSTIPLHLLLSILFLLFLLLPLPLLWGSPIKCKIRNTRELMQRDFSQTSLASARNSRDRSAPQPEIRDCHTGRHIEHDSYLLGHKTDTWRSVYWIL